MRRVIGSSDKNRYWYPNSQDAEQTNASKSINVVDAHHAKNRRPKAPNPDVLTNIRKSFQATVEDVPDEDSEREDGSDEGEDDDKEVSGHADTGRRRAPRNSKTPYGSRPPKPTQLTFYPPQWRDLIEDTKLRFRMTASIKKGFPNRRAGLIEAGDCLMETMAAFSDGGGTVETGMIF